MTHKNMDVNYKFNIYIYIYLIFDKNVRISKDKELKGDKDYPMVIEKNQKL